MCLCAHAHAKTSMPRVCVSLSQIVSHSVSSCVCVSAVAERNSLQGKKCRRVYGRERKRGRDGGMMMMVVMMRLREEQGA